LACRPNSQKIVNPRGFGQIGWYGLVGLVFLSNIAILGGNALDIEYGNP